jgi:polysaccharide chain length determinant protein (PEP-CTERM system associated)
MARDPLSTNSEDSLALRALDILRRRKILAIAAFGTVLAAAVAFAVYLPDLYRASALVLVERPVNESIVRPAMSGELDSRLHVIKQEILSRDRLTQLVNRFNLYPNLRKRIGFEDILTQTRNDIAVEAEGPEQVSGRTKTVSFRLTYTGDSRQSVADVTNAIAAFYVAQNDRIRSEEAMQTTDFLKAQLAEAKQALDHQEALLRQFTTQHTGELPQQMGLNLATLDRMNTQLRLIGEQQLRVIEQRERMLDGMSAAAATPGSAAAARVNADPDASPEMVERLQKIDKSKQELTALEAKFSARHPDVVRLREQLATLEREAAEADAALQAKRKADEEAAAAKAATASAAAAADSQRDAPFRRRTIETLDAELAKLKNDEAAMRGQITAFEQKLASTPERQQEYSLITRDWTAAKDLYDSLLKRYDEAQLAQSIETDRQGERFRVLESAIPPEGPSAPNRVRLMIMGLLLAFAAAVAAVLMAEQFDTSFHSVDELREFTGVPVLVSIPPIGSKPIKQRVRMAFATASALAAIGLIATVSAYFASGNEQLVRIIERAG